MTDEQFLRGCTWDAFRASGPGGQKRNKTSSAVRLTHVPTGCAAVASESRSQHDNRRAALRRLRHRVVLMHRQAVGDGAGGAASLDVSPRSEAYLLTMGFVLDALAASGWSVSAAARRLGVTTSNLVRFLQNDESLMAHVNQQRAAQSLKPLGAQRA